MRVPVKGEGGYGGFIQKAIKKCHKFNKMSNLTPNKNSLKKTMKLGVFFNVILMNLTFLLTGCKLEEGGASFPYGGCFLLAESP